MLYAYHRYDPIRSPDWRFNRIVSIARNNQPPNRVQIDTQIRDGVRFIRTWDRMKTEDDRDALLQCSMGLFHAYEMHQHADPDVRFVVEARILAGQSDEEIASITGALPDTIYWYEALFFNVRDRLLAHDYIVVQIHKQAHENESSHDINVKQVGFFGGPVVLNDLLQGFADGPRPADPADLPAYYDRMQRAKLRSKAFVSALDMKVDRHNVMQLLQVHCQLMEADRGGPLTDEPSDATRAVDGLLAELNWIVSGKSAGLDKRPPTDQFPRAAAELPSDELTNLTYAGNPRKERRPKKRLARRTEFVITPQGVQHVEEASNRDVL
jgi:hypothetical protein